MCGIVGFLSDSSWRCEPDCDWLRQVQRDLGAIDRENPAWDRVETALDQLEGDFNSLMSFEVHDWLDSEREGRAIVEELRRSLSELCDRADETLDRSGSDELQRVREKLDDYRWQVDHEVLRYLERARGLMPPWLVEQGPNRSQRFVAWAFEQTLESLDKLEVRGRDSAGVSVLGLVDTEPDISSGLETELERRMALTAADSGQILLRRDDGGWIVRFVYKVANLVGRLGDNAEFLRREIRGDRLLWLCMATVRQLNLLIHTRWASNGVINVANAHPVDARGIRGKEHRAVESADPDALFVVNGDVDNYRELSESTVRARGLDLDPTISTDAKILPLLFFLDTHGEVDPLRRLNDVLRRCDGSMAVVMQHPSLPEHLFLAQRGSGQSLYAGRVRNGWLAASELYGMAARCHSAYPIISSEPQGIGVALEASADVHQLPAVHLGSGEVVHLAAEALSIHSRDIDRKDFDYYIDKEIHEAPASVRRTLQGKYERSAGEVRFNLASFGNGSALFERMRSADAARISQIIVIGQGTASIAAMGIAHLIGKALERTDIWVESVKASELIGFMPRRRLEDVLVIAVSQSGTTTDTNRVVDLVRERGAWVHAIVNRRNSPLVRKAHSHLYTSNGRDIEMSVASTKAYYSQVAAGKLMALLLATALRSLNAKEIRQEIEILERLPARIEEVLDHRAEIAACAAEIAPVHRYWAVVGNGANHIAAEEIRIKLSELCYKAIPCDFTEDKKHIDLSTEPLTIVVANDLPEEVVQDTVKEVSIFRAHNGRPMVICSRDEDRFDSEAQALLRVPRIGGGMDFVLATVAGHLWGIEAAKTIDAQAALFRDLRGMLSRPPKLVPTSGSLLTAFQAALERVEDGYADSALPARRVAHLARYLRRLESQPGEASPPRELLVEGIDLVRGIIEEMARPIDSIRHQAKTVTVGISRPEAALPPPVGALFELLGVTPADLKEEDSRRLESLTGLISGVPGGLLYEVLEPAERGSEAPPRLRAVKEAGRSKVRDSRFAVARPVEGSKRRVLRMGSAVWSEGREEKPQSVLMLPLFRGDGGKCTHLVLMHLEFVREASVQQKLRLLRQLGGKYDELLELNEEKSIGASLKEILDTLSPRDLAFRTPAEMLHIYADRKRVSAQASLSQWVGHKLSIGVLI